MTIVAIEGRLAEHHSEIAVHRSEIEGLKTSVTDQGKKLDRIILLALGTLASTCGAFVVQLVSLSHGK